MVSRINIGPDGGPYIAINENSGDIELEDNSGNVVAKWDETNTQWDFISNDIQNVGSLDVQNGATFNGSDLTGVGSLGVEQVGSNRYYAGAFNGTDADARLDNALSAASAGDVIHLENTAYTSDRTISTRLTLTGSNTGSNSDGSYIGGGAWTVDDGISLVSVGAGSGSVTIAGDFAGWYQSMLSTNVTVTVDANDFRFIGNRGGDVQFNAGATGGIVDACTATSFADNDGGNTKGDIA